MRIIMGQCDSETIEMLIGYFVSYLPFALIRREALIKHYVIPLIFGIVGLILFVENYFKPFLRGYVLCLLAFFGIFGHIYWGQLVYAKNIIDLDFKVWNKNWL